MKFISSKLLIALAFLDPSGPASEDAEGFSLLKKENNMELSERWLKVEGESERREVRIIMRIDAGREAILETLLDESQGTQWNVNASEYRIEKKGQRQWISYIRYALSFPLSDRECYFLNQVSFNEKEAVIRFRTLESELFSKNSKIEKLGGLEGRWVIREMDSYSLLAYHIISIPDKSLPSWVVDPIIRKNLWATMENLRITTENNVYANK